MRFFFSFLFKYSGFLALAIYLIFTLVSAFINPWFTPLKYPISYLGWPKMANHYWLYNTGVLITGPFIFLFSLYLMRTAENRIQVASAIVILISSVLFFLMGIFISHHPLHETIATAFFITFFIGVLIHGIGEKSHYRVAYIAIFLLFLLTPFVPWPSMGLAEIYGAIFIAIYMYLATMRPWG